MELQLKVRILREFSNCEDALEVSGEYSLHL